MDGNPIGDNKHPFVGPPPAHWNCRSVIIPITKGWDELTKSTDPSVKKKLADVQPARHVRASMDGKVSSKMSFDDWLKNKDAKGSKTPIDILGPKRYNLWKKGELQLNQLIDQSWNPMTVEALERRVGV
jgi:uncharacterized protein with gpF-like domain